MLLKRVYALSLIGHGTRRAHLLGVCSNRFKFVIRDRGGRFASDFDAVLADAGI
jgi:putative transposase